MSELFPQTQNIHLWSGPIYDLWDLFPSKSDEIEFLRQLRKLYYWPGEGLNGGQFVVGDLTCQAIPAMIGERIYEVFVDDIIGTREHLRIVVWTGKQAGQIWILWILEKPEPKYTNEEIAFIRTRQAHCAELA